MAHSERAASARDDSCHPHERRAAVANRHAAVGIVHLQRREQRGGAGIHGQAAGIRSEQEVSAEIFNPRRAARRVGKFVDVSMERGVVRGQRLRRRDDQFPRLDRLRAEVYRLDQRRLGRQAVCRSDEGARLRGEDVSVHRQEPRGRAGRELRRLHGQLVLGHTDRFKCIVSHDGTFNTESAYGTTEELGSRNGNSKVRHGNNRELYRKFSPHLFADKFKTPTLVVHGQNDFRLDVSEGFQLFTTLQRLKVPSKMLYFPDEGHWVLKPQNSRLWYKTVNDWVDQWCK